MTGLRAGSWTRRNEDMTGWTRAQRVEMCVGNGRPLPRLTFRRTEQPDPRVGAACAPGSWIGWLPVADCVIAAVQSQFLHHAVDQALAGQPILCIAVPSRTGGPDGLPVRGGPMQRGVVFESATGSATCTEDVAVLVVRVEEVDVELDTRDEIEVHVDLALAPG